MTKLAPEWVRTNDPVIRSPARYRWATAPAAYSTPIYESIENLDNSRIPVSDSLRDDTVIDTSIQNVSLSSDSDSITISSSISSSDSTDSLPYHSNIPTNHLAIVFPRTQAFGLILIWFNGTSAHMGHFSAKMVACKMQC